MVADIHSLRTRRTEFHCTRSRRAKVEVPRNYSRKVAKDLPTTPKRQGAIGCSGRMTRHSEVGPTDWQSTGLPHDFK
jgi:hypothetical protein